MVQVGSGNLSRTASKCDQEQQKSVLNRVSGYFTAEENHRSLQRNNDGSELKLVSLIDAILSNLSKIFQVCHADLFLSHSPCVEGFSKCT